MDAVFLGLVAVLTALSIVLIGICQALLGEKA